MFVLLLLFDYGIWLILIFLIFTKWSKSYVTRENNVQNFLQIKYFPIGY